MNLSKTADFEPPTTQARAIKEANQLYLCSI